MTTYTLATGLLLLLSHYTIAQDSLATRSRWAPEARITTYAQGGYDLGLFYYPRHSRFSVGAVVASHPIRGQTKELLFTSSNYEPLQMRLAWIVSLQLRYHLKAHREGFFGEIGLGLEAFEVSSNQQRIRNTNGFVAPAIGYQWFPWQRDGLYLMPKAAAVFTLGRPAEQQLESVSFQLRPFFVTPSISLGWKF